MIAGANRLHTTHIPPAYDDGIRACSVNRFAIIEKTMGIIAFLVLGGIAGWIASLVMGTDASQGITSNVIVGVVGALIGGLVFNAFGSIGVTGFNLYSLVVAVLGSILALWLMRLVRTA